MPTLKQKQTAEKTLENVGKQKPQTRGRILREVGYKESIQKNPSKVYGTKGYKEAEEELARKYNIDKDSLLKRYAEIFHDEDKRSAISAGQEITKIRGYYKEREIKALGLFKDLEE